ncbi:MAG: diguanylate cyclase, partial [Acholeplasmataceae bacterium]|nr:diguanylate cyclase [Acholeplasmataceae bacterium]
MEFIRQALEIFSDLLNNAILLFGLGFIYAATNYEQQKSTLFRKVFLGIIIGAIAIMIMSNPWKLQEGLIFDTRSVILGVTGLFFGGITTVVAALIALIYRITLGGIGVYSGILTIVLTSGIGLSWFYIRKKLPHVKPFIEYLIFGVFIHIVTLLCFFAIPWPTSINVIKNTALPYLTLFPLLTMALALIVHNQKDRALSQAKIKNQQLLLQASIDATNAMEVFALDKHLCYLSFNEYHFHSMKEYYGIEIEKGKKFLDYIENHKMRARIQESLNISLKGNFHSGVALVETFKEKYVEEQYSPIFDDEGSVIGVTVFSQDITDRKKYEQSILYLSYRDPLTNLHNRRYYSEEIKRLDDLKYYPLSIITADINGLKIMNDAFGHEAGDQLLCTVSDQLIKVFKNESRIARIGGDEFVILLPNTSKEKAKNAIEEAKKLIEHTKINEMNISVSFGLSTKLMNEDVEDVLKYAEDDMYSKKLFEVSSHRNETVKTILNTLHEKNPREEKHSLRVSKICLKMGTALRMKSEEIKLLEAISNLHDIGKIAIDDAILNKPGKLDDKEWEQIKKHPEIGYRILSTTPEYAEIAQDILSHHERYDGFGYPRGIKGEDIPLRARIISIADSYDAMISERPYRKPLTHQEAIEEIRKNLGTQFDPTLGTLFIDLFSKQLE